jgi:hypothetical protein
LKLAVAIVVLLLAGCAKPATKSVVILGNHTQPAVCEHADADAEKARAEAWKAYAGKLETRLGIPHEDIR